MRAIYSALEEVDFGALEELAFSRFGFCSAEIRRAVWLTVLGLSHDDARDESWRLLLQSLRSEGKEAKEARVMQADVQRSVYSWDVHVGIRKKVRDQKRIQLSEVMHGILAKHGVKFTYFQGFHDIALVFLEVGTPSQAFHMVERLALFHMSDQLCWPFPQGLMPMLSVLFVLIELLDDAVATALRESDCEELHFAIPWVLTWFSHSLPKLHEQVMRLFDCLLISHPTMIFYFCASLILKHRELILRTPREMSEMVPAMQSLSLADIDVDEWAVDARKLALQFPPEQLILRLPSQVCDSLPPTSPLWHFPHPWMQPRLEEDPPLFPGPSRASNVLDLAPVYSGAVGNRLIKRQTTSLRQIASGLQAAKFLAIVWKGMGIKSLVRTVGVGSVAALTCAVLFRNIWAQR